MWFSSFAPSSLTLSFSLLSSAISPAFFRVPHIQWSRRSAGDYRLISLLSFPIGNSYCSQRVGLDYVLAPAMYTVYIKYYMIGTTETSYYLTEMEFAVNVSPRFKVERDGCSAPLALLFVFEGHYSLSHFWKQRLGKQGHLGTHMCYPKRNVRSCSRSCSSLLRLSSQSLMDHFFLVEIILRDLVETL